MFLSEDARNFLHRYFNFTSTLFWLHQRRELRRFKNFFDTVEKQPLTKLQRRSVILNERRNLVVAGAGTGKTSVIIAKAGYLIKSGRARPEEILLLAYNNEAAKELSDRCTDRLAVEIPASTFHSLGNQIIGAVEPVTPTLSRFANDRQFFGQFLNTTIEHLKAEEKTWKRARAFILGHLKPYRSESDFASLEEYEAYTRTVELRALSGHLVKSFAELDIANFLFFNGVRFEYEKRYPHEAGRYHPDFYLTDYDIWIEHFGIDRNGGTAPYVDQKKYTSEMAWKRAVHARYKTKLVETYSWQKSEGVLASRLNRVLKERGVQYEPPSQEEIFAALQKWGYTSQLAILVGAFLSHFKSNQMSFMELARKAANSDDRVRAEAFKELFQFVFDRYQAELESKTPREIDFNDMITLATRYVQTARFKVSWKYIIVDEFQDISIGRYLLLKAMLQSRSDLKFFAVGDDWQSIYRFAGSDISIMRQFRESFGSATIVKLDETFRFNDRIANVSNAFIQKNPSQIRKTLRTRARSQSPRVLLHRVDANGGTRQSYVAGLKDIIDSLKEKQPEDKPSLLILSRYNHLLPDRSILQPLEENWPGEIKTPLTFHRAKGTEADYVVVIGLTADRYGFPSEIDDHPLLDLVLARPEGFPNAEERRLFYVALTRARHQVHLLIDRARPSSFALELLRDGYDVEEVAPRVKEPTSDPPPEPQRETQTSTLPPE
jgi:DNA helicase-4